MINMTKLKKKISYLFVETSELGKFGVTGINSKVFFKCVAF